MRQPLRQIFLIDWNCGKTAAPENYALEDIQFLAIVDLCDIVSIDILIQSIAYIYI